MELAVLFSVIFVLMLGLVSVLVLVLVVVSVLVVLVVMLVLVLLSWLYYVPCSILISQVAAAVVVGFDDVTVFVAGDTVCSCSSLPAPPPPPFLVGNPCSFPIGVVAWCYA